MTSMARARVRATAGKRGWRDANEPRRVSTRYLLRAACATQESGSSALESIDSALVCFAVALKLLFVLVRNVFDITGCLLDCRVP